MGLAWVYFFYAMIMIVAVVFGILLLPETAGKEMGKYEENPDEAKGGEDEEEAKNEEPTPEKESEPEPEAAEAQPPDAEAEAL